MKAFQTRISDSQFKQRLNTSISNSKKAEEKNINDRKCEVMQLPEGCDAMNQRKVVGHGRISAFIKSILQMSFSKRGKGRRI
ncbi:hypothetical protein T11_6756 [Trichinella zimbabwensis]|uniref:Uncharacterized protein n=1 Tax=Trichinella zimbabwensis TaxID=268475 RepID=A0A0V1GUU9_9BILA|nr:hypothetical protein T11_6756 [Trichinella zimbabwensis]